MPCYHPLYALPEYKPSKGGLGTDVYHTKNGKIRYRIFKSDSVPWENPDLIQIPCGKCIGCRLEYSRQWANRCMLELQDHESAYFVTLTYNDGNLPKTWYTDSDTGEAFQAATLVKRDVQLFMKRLRKAFDDQHIRFYCAGEYGDESMRPHYHLILFGLKLDDLSFYEQRDGFNYFTSSKLNKIWDYNCADSHIDNGKRKVYNVDTKRWSTAPLKTRGLCIVANVNWDTCAYVARYVTKKLNGPEAQFYKDHNIEPPFSLMSRKPGIGRNYFDSHKDMFDQAYINVSTPEGGRKFKPPKYYKRLFELDDPEQAEQMRDASRRLANELARIKASQTTESYKESLETEENVHRNRTKVLRRSAV